MKKFISCVLITTVFLQTFSFSKTVLADENGRSTTRVQSSQSDDDNFLLSYIDKANSYAAYYKKYSGMPSPDRTITIPAVSFKTSQGEAKVLDNYEDAAEPVLQCGDSGYVEWEVDVETAGMYNMGMMYFPIEGKSSNIERELYIDGKVPFNEARTLTFTRIWKDKTAIRRDSQGNDVRPSQVESPQWVESTFKDSEELYDSDFKFYFSKGKHTIRLNAIREPIVIKYLKLFKEENPKSYEEVRSEHASEKDASDVQIKIQGEKTYLKSSPTLYPFFDRTNPKDEPFDVSKIRLNTIGGNNWNRSGDWLSWKVEVPKDGFYNIGMRFRQNTVAGIPVTRRIEIDGKLPFKELDKVPFKYSSNWQLKVLGKSEDDPYKIYLTKGTHEIKMTMTIGNISDVIRNVQQASTDLSQLYTKIVMITGPNPDQYRDYQLDKVIPELIPTLQENAKIIRTEIAEVKKLSNGGTGNISALSTLAYQMEQMVKNPDTITERLSNFKDNVSAIATWVMTIREQPLDIDYLVISSPDEKMPKVNPNIFQKVGFEVKNFFASFITNYNVLGDSKNSKDSINVWVMLGRDQANTLKSMIDETFTPKTHIKVNLNLVNNENVLLFSVASKNNNGPDAALGVSKTNPVDYGVRGALVDLSRMSEYDSVKDRFMGNAIEPYSYNGKVYGLPQTQSFPMLFYRKDIMQKLNLKVPETWDDLYKVLAVIEEKNLQFAPGELFNSMLMQNGGTYYSDDFKKCTLDSKQGMEAFIKWTNLYTEYGLPQQYDFFNRFRNGEMPIGIADYTLYNQLSVAAPQIKGLWDIAPIPGTRKDNGTIDRTISASATVASSTTGGVATTSGTAAVIFNNSKKQDKAWEFLKWWTSTDTQVRFGKELEALLGAAARYNTANVEAMGYLAWPTSDYKKLMDQWKNVKEVPVIPGSYYTTRHVDNAFKEVVIQNVQPREALSKYVKTINEEITKKRTEFGLDK